MQELERRAEDILEARPAYREMLEFYLDVFRLQIEWQDKVIVRPEPVEPDRRRDCLKQGQPLAECYDSGVDTASLVGLWTEMKGVFRGGNEVLRKAVTTIDRAEESGSFQPATWLLGQRPDREEMVSEASRQIGVEEGILATLARSVTFPHWNAVSRCWLADEQRERWQRSRCPICGGTPSLAELRKVASQQRDLSAATRRFMHCAFCGSRWATPTMACPGCGSAKPGDAKYLFTETEPELRIEFCRSCSRYLKVIDGDKISGQFHVGLELLTSAHLDVIARDKNLSPLAVCT